MKLSLGNRVRQFFGLPIKASTSGYPAYSGASLTRLNADWIGQLLSPNQEKRTSLKMLRKRCRQLRNNNDYAAKFISLVRQNVVGPFGINLEVRVTNTSTDEIDDVIGEQIEEAWEAWGQCCSADQVLSWLDVCNLAMETLVVDGEVFLRKVRGYPYNDFRFALQFIDADQVDVNHNRRRHTDGDGNVLNEIAMGIELDEWGRRVAYWIYTEHPSEGGGLAGKRERIPAEDMLHLFVSRRPGDTRGTPFFVTSMESMNMLAGYEYAEVVAARLAACKMAVITSKTGEEYNGTLNKNSGAVEMNVEPASIDQLPEGMNLTPIDWQHPNGNFENFSKQMVRKFAIGTGCSYASLSGDLREVNFSSIRQGELEARDYWRVLQTFAVNKLCKPIFAEFVAAALVSGQLRLAVSRIDEYIKAAVFQPRGWDWVDPLKDIEAAIAGRGAYMDTYARICGARGYDWREVMQQCAEEDKYAAKLGLTLNLVRPTPNSIGADPADKGDQPDKPPKKRPAFDDEEQGRLRILPVLAQEALQ